MLAMISIRNEPCNCVNNFGILSALSERLGTIVPDWERLRPILNDSERLGKVRKDWESFKKSQNQGRQGVTYFGPLKTPCFFVCFAAAGGVFGLRSGKPGGWPLRNMQDNSSLLLVAEYLLITSAHTLDISGIPVSISSLHFSKSVTARI